jgi:hypothetical protein
LSREKPAPADEMGKRPLWDSSCKASGFVFVGFQQAASQLPSSEMERGVGSSYIEKFSFGQNFQIPEAICFREFFFFLFEKISHVLFEI